MEKTIHESVTEVDSSPASEKAANDVINEVAVHPPAQKPDTPKYGIRRTNTVHRHRREKPLPLDRFAHRWHRVPRAIKLLVIVILTGIPFMIFMLVSRYALRHRYIGPASLEASYFKLSKWLTACWASLLIIFGLAEVFARMASWTCSLSKHWTKYAPLANTLCFRLTMLVWAGVAYQVNCQVWTVSYIGKDNWPATLKQTFVFLIISFAVLLVQGILLQLIAIRYVEGYVGPRARKGLKEIETIRDLNNLIKKHLEHDDPSYFVKILKRAFFPVEDSTFDAIVNGTATEEAHREYAATLWNRVTTDIHKDTLTAEDISSRLIAMGRDPEVAEDLFAQLDVSCDGQVTRNELEDLVVNTGAQLNKRADSLKGIKNLLFKLELLLTCLVFGVIVFIYSNFFNQDWVKDSKALWTGFTGLGFALNGTITDFVACCVFVFAKHAYDVGDVVEAMDKKLLVRDIHLTHTNFLVEAMEKRMFVRGTHLRDQKFLEVRKEDAADATGMIVQINHATLASEVIVNWTRSNDLKIAKMEKESGFDALIGDARPSMQRSTSS